jgi:hypothetical protein
MAAAEESFVERGLFGGAITCCIPANFYVSFPSLSLHSPSLLFLVPRLLVAVMPGTCSSAFHAHH